MPEQIAVNRHLIEGMAHVGMGEPFVVLEPAKAEAAAKKFQKYIESPVLTNVEIAFDGFDTYDVERRGDRLVSRLESRGSGA